MLERLDTTSRALEAALDDYLQTCQAIHGLYVDGHPINTIPHGLATDLAKHLPRIQSLREKLQLTEKVVRHSVNASSSLVPIHALPWEVLIRIFELVRGDDCIGHRQSQCQKSPALMDTCSHWRQVMINSPTLWTHIDLAIQVGGSVSSRISHAEVYAQRAAQMPLHVHIIDTFKVSMEEHHAVSASFVPFIASIASRVQSLTFEPYFPPVHRHVLSELFNSCTPGVLTTLVANLRRGQKYYLDTGISTELYAISLVIGIPRERLEEVLLGIKVLRLRYLYPNWASNAYQGLVELRLQSIKPHQFTESQLVEALRQSPGLRILECAARPASPLDGDERIQPIPLIDLEVVNLGYNASKVVEEIVRWLAPGPKPLQFLITDTGSVGPSLSAFFARSNVTRVYSLEYNPGNALHMVRYLPRLQSIVLAFWPMAPRSHGQEYGVSDKAPSAPETIYITGYNFGGLMALQNLVSLESLHRVIFYCCRIWDTEEFLSGLSMLNPRASFRIVPNHEPDPIDEWEVFSPRSP
ncbi:hypothetical protein RSAG8_10475, partial [Rhizoctonia solani AG-8 WAC10335]